MEKTMLLFSEYIQRDSFLTPHGDYLKLDRVLQIQLKVWTTQSLNCSLILRFLIIQRKQGSGGLHLCIPQCLESCVSSCVVATALLPQRLCENQKTKIRVNVQNSAQHIVSDQYILALIICYVSSLRSGVLWYTLMPCTG